MQKLFFVLVLSMAANTLRAQTSEIAAICATLENYMSGEKSRVERAFHPSAAMKFIHYQTGEFTNIPIADYIARLDDGKKPANPADVWVRQIETISVEGNAAQAKINIDAGKMFIYDYMSLLKVNGEWKIVSKILYRKDK